MAQQNLEEVFQELKEYAGRTIRILRVLRGLTKKELSLKLRNLGWNNANAKLIRAIEFGKKEISFQKLPLICEATGKSIVEFLRVMKDLHDKDGESGLELLKETREEIEYNIWANHGKSSELLNVLKEELERRIKEGEQNQ